MIVLGFSVVALGFALVGLGSLGGLENALDRAVAVIWYWFLFG
jgi:hypothetical protein